MNEKGDQKFWRKNEIESNDDLINSPTRDYVYLD